jgi:2-hydroxychromene-2-carboxylate isomerase
VIRATLYTDPGCPWGYSANPALRVLEWRFGDQLDWRLVMIGLREEANQAGFDSARRAANHAYWRDMYGMPFGLVPKARAAATGRGCRAVVAAGQLEPGLEWVALRALYFGQFTTDLLLDDDEMVRDALNSAGLDGDAIVSRLDDPAVAEAYEAGKAEARTAAGTAAEAQDKTATSDGPVRYTAPSVVFERNGDRVVAGGWQPLLAYDVLLANMDPTLRREPPPESPAPLLDRFPGGLTTAEVAALLADGPDCVPDSAEAERALVALEAAGGATRTRLGQDSVWTAAGNGESRPRAWTAAALA